MATGDAGLSAYVNTTICVVTNDGRAIVGLLRGYDQATNLILDECHERVFSVKQGVERLALGLYVIRGDNIAVVGEVDEDRDETTDWQRIRAAPLPVITH